MAREGARWINERPEATEFAAWFKENVQIDDALDHDKYVGGCVLIPATEKVKTVSSTSSDGSAVIIEKEQLVYVPYSKVETRIDYFWDLVEAHNRIGVVAPVETKRPEAMTTIEETTSEDGLVTRRESTRLSAVGQIVEQLPPGFFVMSVPVGEAYSHFLCCSYRAAIYERGEDGEPKGAALREGHGTKMVGLTRSSRHNPPRVWADENSIMKAETGAKGRALGFAGILTIPGSGVATAEDMIENATNPDAAATPAPAEGAGPAKPPNEQTGPSTGAEAAQTEQEQLLDRARKIVADLRESYPEGYDEFGQYAKSLKPPVTDLTSLAGARLRGVVKRLEKIQDAHKAKAKEGVTPGEEQPATEAEAAADQGPEQPPPPQDPGAEGGEA